MNIDLCNAKIIGTRSPLAIPRIKDTSAIMYTPLLEHTYIHGCGEGLSVIVHVLLSILAVEQLIA